MSNPYFKSWYKKKRSQSSKQFDENEISCIEKLPNFGYAGFRLYFPEETDGERINKSVSYFEQYIQSNQSNYNFNNILTDRYFAVDYKVLAAEDDIFSSWENFTDDVINNTEYCLNCFGLAMYQFIINCHVKKNEEQDENVIESEDILPIQAKIINFEPTLQLKNLKVIYYGKLVSIKGTVIKVGQVKVICQYLAFSCPSCTGTQLVKQKDGIYTMPNNCPTKGCRVHSNFAPLHSSAFNRTISWQSIKIQELITSQEFENSKVPRSLDCELMGDLVKSCIPGDDITITGIIKVRDVNSNNCKNKQNTIFNLYLETVSVYNSKRQNKGSYSDSEGIIFNTNDYYLIQKIHSESKLFRLLVLSLCPNIYGHEIVKAGLLLALFGGTKSDTVRAEPHILIVGDPGLGKSQMLRACTNVAPRGVYVCGNTSTSSGLTVTMTRESGEHALEAGALMLADKGCCCIDEFDKMPSQHASLLEAMEQQTISIAKAGILCSLPARTTILAAANPSGGHYNKGKTIAENLKISSPMLSRFDLIFILLDQANEQLDRLLSKHILNAHNRKKNENRQDASTSFFNNSNSETDTLIDRLRSNGETVDLLPHALFRKYIAYAQRYVSPQLSDGAKEVLKKYYLDLRKQYQTGDCTPITTRQLHSLIRLTQARAKAELREEATEGDALDVVEIMKYSLIDIFTDEHGLIDKTRCQNGTGMSTKNQAIKLLQMLQRKSDVEAKKLFSTKEIREMGEQVGITKEKFYNILQSLNIQGFLLNKGGGKIGNMSFFEVGCNHSQCAAGVFVVTRERVARLSFKSSQEEENEENINIEGQLYSAGISLIESICTTNFLC
ncbi:DNA helicase MCM8-like [Anoplophora glabripennis]|uniref:DNA helicase MCM8-like n=1 Tax=Anoplophora glabripennis TaxID=217634 RepID=UPI000874C3F4|nr:DNA helicase MCM8-like [Anoplophora glabripennis]